MNKLCICIFDDLSMVKKLISALYLKGERDGDFIGTED